MRIYSEAGDELCPTIIPVLTMRSQTGTLA